MPGSRRSCTPPYSGSGKTVDPRSGNVSQQVTDAHVATVGPALSVVRTYNSLDPRTSQAFGAGWDLSGDFPNVAAWNNYVRRFAERRDQPLQVLVGN